MKSNKRKRSEVEYMEIVRSLLWYWCDFIVEDEFAKKIYNRLYKIANARFYENHRDF